MCLHTVNNQCIIIHTLGQKEGIMHDYDIYKRNQYMIPKQVADGYDLGYLVVGVFPRTTITYNK
ncbi:MAG TPA: hypothetical protein VIY08_07180 [Candidatus Nitrosocosmicus sp.]